MAVGKIPAAISMIGRVTKRVDGNEVAIAAAGCAARADHLQFDADAPRCLMALAPTTTPFSARLNKRLQLTITTAHVAI